jgi:hypothetical protein
LEDGKHLAGISWAENTMNTAAPNEKSNMGDKHVQYPFRCISIFYIYILYIYIDIPMAVDVDKICK